MILLRFCSESAQILLGFSQILHRFCSDSGQSVTAGADQSVPAESVPDQPRPTVPTPPHPTPPHPTQPNPEHIRSESAPWPRSEQAHLNKN